MLPPKKVIKIIYLYIQTGPTQVGDGHSDPDLMKCIDAALVKDKLLGFTCYNTKLTPSQVLDQLKARNIGTFKIEGMTAYENRLYWTVSY